VAEAWVAPDKKKLYASAEGLGQTFSFDMLVCEWDSERLRETINNSLVDAKESNSSTTWVLSNHDVSRLVPVGLG
jgi:alpha-glucosidase